MTAVCIAGVIETACAAVPQGSITQHGGSQATLKVPAYRG